MSVRLKTGDLSDKNAVFLAIISKDVTPYLSKIDVWGEVAKSSISQMLMTMRWDNTLGFLGGKVDAGETLTEALLREVEEEGGLFLSNKELEKLKLFCTHKIKDGMNSHLFTLEVTLDRLREIQKNSFNGEDFYTESAGLVICHIHEKSINNLLKSSLAKTVKEEIEDLVEEGVI